MPPTLDAGGLVLRRFLSEDAEQVFDAVQESGEDLSTYETWARPPFSRADAAEYVGWWTAGWEDRTSYFYVVERGRSLIGACGLFGFDSDSHEMSLGFWIRSSQTGRGYASSAARTIADSAFGVLGLRRIEMQVAPSNTASLKVCNKIGAVADRVESGRLDLDGIEQDAVVFTLWPDRGTRLDEAVEA